jgi:PIN domain nuclease of toxin-antitoxin system
MTIESGVVLDASALLALLLEEPGGDQVSDALRGAVISAINWAEVLQVMTLKGGDSQGLRSEMEQRGLTFAQLVPDDATEIAELYPPTRRTLSLADGAYVVLARRLGLPVLTGDRVWADLDLGVDVRLIR